MVASSARFTPNIDTSALMALGKSSAGPIYLYAVKTGARVQTKAAQNLSGPMVKVRTGNLRSSGHTTTEIKGNTLVETIAYDAEYALAVHEGTQPHEIDPKGARVLAWQSPTGPAFAARVHHPGTQGRPFLFDALKSVITT